jgi:hypothetical protein
VLTGAVADDGNDLGIILRVVARLRLTGRLRVALDGWTGDVSFNEGQPVSAEFGTERGWPALEAILLVLADGDCTFIQEPPAAEPNLMASPETVEQRLDEVTRRLSRLTRAVPSLSAVPQIRQPPSDWRAGGDVTLPRSALTTLTAIDGYRSVGQLCLGHRLTRTVEDLALLVDLGLVGIVAPASPAGPPDRATPRDAAAGTEPPPASPHVSNEPSRLAIQSRHHVASLGRTLRDSSRLLLTRAQRPRREVRWLAILSIAAMVVIGLVLSLQVVVGSTAAPRRPHAFDASVGAADGRAVPQASNSGSKPRLLLDERFGSNAGNWPNNPQSTAWLADGAYRLVARRPGQFVALGAPIAQVAPDVVVSATLRKTGGPPGGGYGLIVRDQGPGPRDGLNQTGNFYVLLVNDRGEVGMTRREGDHWVEIVPWTASDAVQQGTAANELIALAIGPQLGLAVNGTLIVSREDQALTAGGVGLYLGGDGGEVSVERFRVEELPASPGARR